MSGVPHQRTGWTYGERPRGTCPTCLISRVLDTHGRMVAHRWKGERCKGSGEPAQPPTADAVAPSLRDNCGTCGHLRWRHRQVDGQQVCTEYVDCSCSGHFVELPQATRMARIVEAAQGVTAAMRAVGTAMTEAHQVLHSLHAALHAAGLLSEEEPRLCDGCDSTDHPVTATDDGRALLCPSCMRILKDQPAPTDQ